MEHFNAEAQTTTLSDEDTSALANQTTRTRVDGHDHSTATRRDTQTHLSSECAPTHDDAHSDGDVLVVANQKVRDHVEPVGKKRVTIKLKFESN